MNKSIDIKHFTFKVGDEILSARITYNSLKNNPSIVSLHGAGTANKDRISYILESLAENGFSSLSFDFSGHGKSTGTLHDSSLSKRLVEAQAAIQYLDNNRRVTVIGSSMGAHIAVKLIDYIQVNTLILFCPAFYTSRAEEVPFDEHFSKIIRQNDSWKDSNAFQSLKEFKGNLLVVIGEKDTVIPKALIKKIDSVSIKARKKFILTIPEANHQLHTFIENNNSVKNEVQKTLVELLTKP